MESERFAEALKKGAHLCTGLLETHQEEIRRAYVRAEDRYKVNLSIEFSPLGESIGVEAGIAFVESKVKDSASAVVSAQPDLPL